MTKFTLDEMSAIVLILERHDVNMSIDYTFIESLRNRVKDASDLVSSAYHNRNFKVFVNIFENVLNKLYILKSNEVEALFYFCRDLSRKHVKYYPIAERTREKELECYIILNCDFLERLV